MKEFDDFDFVFVTLIDGSEEVFRYDKRVNISGKGFLEFYKEYPTDARLVTIPISSILKIEGLVNIRKEKA